MDAQVELRHWLSGGHVIVNIFSNFPLNASSDRVRSKRFSSEHIKIYPIQRNSIKNPFNTILSSIATTYDSFKDKAKSWLDRYGNVLRELGFRGLK